MGDSVNTRRDSAKGVSATVFSGRTFLITGASSGIGAATAIAAARRGARLILIGRQAAKLAAVVEAACPHGCVAHALTAELSSSETITSLASRIRADFGTPDVLVNSAGAGSWRFYDETSADDAAAMMAVPYLAAFAFCRELVPQMVARGSGHVVDVTSAASFLAWPGATAYVASRFALRGFHEALSADLARTGVHTTLATFAQVQSDYWLNNPGSEERIPKAQSMIRVLSSAEAGEAIVRGIERKKRLVVEPFNLRLVLWMARVFPKRTTRIMISSGYSRPIPAAPAPHCESDRLSP